jgi:glycosyltransferase involved in cell wall biosynthesis
MNDLDHDSLRCPKILLLSEPFPPFNPGGAGKLSEIFVREIAKRNCHLYLVCIDKKINETIIYSDKITIQRVQIDHWEWEVETFTERNRKVLPLLEELHNEINFDVLYDLGGFLYFDIVRDFSARYEIPIVTHFLILMKPYLLYTAVPQYMIDLFHDLQILQAKCSDLVFTTSESERIYYQENFGAKKPNDILLHNAVHVPEIDLGEREKLKAKLPHGKRFFFFGGRISDKLKGIDRAIGLFKQLRKVNPNCRLVLTNSSNIDFELIGLEEKDFILFDRLPEDQYYALLSLMDVILCPSYYEAFGMLAIEGGICGAQVIASNLGGHKDTIGNYVKGYLLEDNWWHETPAELLSQLSQIKRNDTLLPHIVPPEITAQFWVNEILKKIKNALN